MLNKVWLKQPNTRGKTAILLGGFDGLHVGHQHLLERAKESNLPIGVMTIVGAKQDNALFTLKEREEIFKNFGADFVFELSFSEIKNLSPKAFLDVLEEELSPALFVCGEDFRFGAGAVGSSKNMKDYTHVPIEIISLVEMEGVKISASHIKALLFEGEIEKANARLGHPFFLIGEVKEDRKVGRTMGFPTANVLYPKDKFSLKTGVYETRVVLDGKTYKGITNYGARPTFDDQTVLTETHLIDFSSDLYGREIKVEFIRYLRDVRKFDSIDGLKKQLEEDLRRVRTND